METGCCTFETTLLHRSWCVILDSVETQATSHKCKCLEFNPRFAESRLIKLRKLTLRHLASASATNCHPRLDWLGKMITLRSGRWIDPPIAGET